MALVDEAADGNETRRLLSATPPQAPAANDGGFGLAYLIFFVLGAGFLLPWNAFITAVDYFTYLYPGVPVDRIFSVAYMPSILVPLLALLLLLGVSAGSTLSLRINAGLALFVASLLVVPIMDAVYVRGRPGIYPAFDITVAAAIVCGVADALVQSGVVAFAGELPERYMQAVYSGTAASGVLVNILRIITKAIYPQNAWGLRNSAIIYFISGIVLMAMCIVCYNVMDKLPVVIHYKSIKRQAIEDDINKRSGVPRSVWISNMWLVVGQVKWHGLGLFLIYIVTLSIFPGYITEDVQSAALGDWYPIILITAYNVFDLVGKSLPAIYLLQNANIAVAGCFARLLFYPLFLGCLHGPEVFRTEVPVAILTSLLGLTNGYLTSILMILAPKAVPIQHSETTGVVLIIFTVFGLVAGSLVSWFWVV